MQPTCKILVGDVRKKLLELEAGSMHCAVTSPPYFRLREYGDSADELGREETHDCGGWAEAASYRCGKCYVCHMTDVFRGVRRALRDDGTFWLNVGDTYTGGGRGAGGNKQKTNIGSLVPAFSSSVAPKNLLGIPWRLALSMQADGWILRGENIWWNPSKMPTSQKDRCTVKHETVFLFSKSPAYFYDDLAIAEHSKIQNDFGERDASNQKYTGTNQCEGTGLVKKNFQVSTKGTIWRITSEPLRDSHYAPFPSALPNTCLSAGTSAVGVCEKCGAPHIRQVDRKQLRRERPNEHTKRTGEKGTGNSCGNGVAGVTAATIGWQASCECKAGIVPATVLDPFCGAGTTGLAARRLGHNFVGIELYEEFAEMATSRINSEVNRGVRRHVESSPGQMELFE